MNENRYRPPRANIDPRHREPGSIPRAVAVGAAIDIGGTILCSFVLGLLYATILGLQGLSSEAIAQSLNEFDRWSAFGLLLTAAGLTMSVLGGYQCGVIANRRTYQAPGILSLVSVTIGALLNDGRTQLPELLFFSALTVAALLGGAYLHIRKLSEPATRTTAKD